MEAPLEVRWSAEAVRDREAIVRFIWLDNPSAARRMNAIFDRATTRLAWFPKSGPPGQLPGTRELLPHPSYRMIYTTDPDAVTILALVHTARQWPPLEDGTT
ncbi:MAG: type II toxin-antitoxin system RelE/ParE family toxin [Mesorhizobium sp.]